MQYKTAIVTGASSGIGASIAKQLCLRNTKVYALARTESRLKSVQKSLPNAKQNLFIPIVCDVSKASTVDNTMKSIFSKADVDLIVNNAGVGFYKDLTKHSPSEIEQVIATNLYGTINITRSVLTCSDRTHPLQIVNTASLAGRIGFPQMSIYSATKFAIIGLTEALRLEYANKKVAFTVLLPGKTDTDFFAKAGMEDFQASVKDLKSYYSSDKVAAIFLTKLRPEKNTIVIGNDKIFLKLLPFIPFKLRFKVLDIVNKL